MTTTDFFQQLYKLIEPQTWTLVVTAKDNVLTISLYPTTDSKLSPVTISGKVEDSWEDFFSKISTEMQIIKLKVAGLEQIKKEIDEQIKAKKKEATGSSKTTTAGKKPETKKEEDKPMPIMEGMEEAEEGSDDDAGEMPEVQEPETKEPPKENPMPLFD